MSPAAFGRVRMRGCSHKGPASVVVVQQRQVAPPANFLQTHDIVVVSGECRAQHAQALANAR